MTSSIAITSADYTVHRASRSLQVFNPQNENFAEIHNKDNPTQVHGLIDRKRNGFYLNEQEGFNCYPRVVSKFVNFNITGIPKNQTHVKNIPQEPDSNVAIVMY